MTTLTRGGGGEVKLKIFKKNRSLSNNRLYLQINVNNQKHTQSRDRITHQQSRAHVNDASLTKSHFAINHLLSHTHTPKADDKQIIRRRSRQSFHRDNQATIEKLELCWITTRR